MMHQSRGKIGIVGTTLERIKKWALEPMSDNDLTSGRKGESARDDTVADILVNELRMFPRDVENNVVDVYVTTGRPDKENDNGIIIWITSNEGFVKRIFQ